MHSCFIPPACGGPFLVWPAAQLGFLHYRHIRLWATRRRRLSWLGAGHAYGIDTRDRGVIRIAENPLPRCCIALLRIRSEEHTSELQSRPHLVCRLLLEKKKKT